MNVYNYTHNTSQRCEPSAREQAEKDSTQLPTQGPWNATTAVGPPRSHMTQHVSGRSPSFPPNSLSKNEWAYNNGNTNPIWEENMESEVKPWWRTHSAQTAQGRGSASCTLGSGCLGFPGELALALGTTKGPRTCSTGSWWTFRDPAGVKASAGSPQNFKHSLWRI